MKQSQKNILMHGSIGAVIGATLCLIAIATVKPSLFNRADISPQDEMLCVENTIFNTEAIVPNTDVKILYPSEGFYGMGAEVSYTTSSMQQPFNRDILSPTGQGRHVLGSIQIMPTKEPIVYEPSSELNYSGQIFRGMSATVTVYEKKVTGDIQTFIERLKKESDLDTRSEINAGYWVPVSGHIYYVYNTGDDVSRWVALAFGDEVVVETVFSDINRGEGDQYSLLRGYQRRVIEQALSHISFE